MTVFTQELLEVISDEPLCSTAALNSRIHKDRPSIAAVLGLLGERWLEKRIYERLSRWFWCGILGELYGGAVESRMALDLPELIEWLAGGDTEPTTVRDANFHPGRLDTLRSRLSAAYRGINVLIQRNGAQDFFWKSTIRDLDESDWEECKLDIHHVFPRAWCERQSIPIPAKRYNSILNKTPISYKANRMIGGRAPSEYLKQLQTHKNVQIDDAGMDRILASHYLDSASLRANNFEQFIERRRQLLIELIAEVMGKAVIATTEPVADDDLDEEDVAAPAEASTSSLTTVALGEGDSRPRITDLAASAQKKSKWPDWQSAIAGMSNSVIAEFFRQELYADRERYLPKRLLRYRVDGKRRWIVRGGSQFAYVWQEGRFQDDNAYWRAGLSEPDQVRAVAGGRALRFHLYTDGDIRFFRQALTDKAGVYWSDGKQDGELRGEDNDKVDEPD